MWPVADGSCCRGLPFAQNEAPGRVAEGNAAVDLGDIYAKGRGREGDGDVALGDVGGAHRRGADADGAAFSLGHACGTGEDLDHHVVEKREVIFTVTQ